MKINNSPVRTARNFNINNIEIDDKEFDNRFCEFLNAEIITEDTKLDIDEGNIRNIDLHYGLGNESVNQIKNNCNYNKRFIVRSKCNNQIQINYNFDKDNRNLINYLDFDLKEDTCETVIIKYESKEDFKFFQNSIIKTNLEKNSCLNIVILNLLNDSSDNFISMENTLLENSKINYIIVDFGGGQSITNLYINQIGKNSNCDIKTIYLGKKNQKFDINYICDIYGEKSKVNIEVQGALNDLAVKHFKGTINFKKGCKNSVGNENESCMLLSQKAKSVSLPMLLCSEEAVEGNHSTSSGKISEKELFYVMSRGFSYKDAQKLMVRAKFNKVIMGIKNEEIRNRVLYEIENS